MNITRAFFILRHGSAEGRHKYLEAVKVIEDEYSKKRRRVADLEEQLSAADYDLSLLEQEKRFVEAAAIKKLIEALELVKRFRACIGESEYELSVTMTEIDKVVKSIFREGESK